MKKKDSKLTNAGVSAYNKPKRTPGHKTKSHVVVAKENGKTKTIRFGQQGVSGSPKTKGESDAAAARRKSFKARHSSNIEKGKMSAAYWSNKTKWQEQIMRKVGKKAAKKTVKKAAKKKKY